MKKSCLSSPAMTRWAIPATKPVSGSKNSPRPTTRWLTRVAITLASPRAANRRSTPRAPTRFSTPATERFNQDAALQAVLANTVTLDSVQASDFDAVFYPGHGPLWDLVDNTASIALIEAFVAASKPVAAVCHASAVLVNARDTAGQPLVAGRKVTGFSNTEEDAVQLTDIVPLLVEDALQVPSMKKARTGAYLCAKTA
jgi:putative intracellular protease/amidase